MQLRLAPSPVAPQRTDPAQPSVLRAANRIADALGLFRRPLSAAELIDLARRRTGLRDFGAPGFEVPLEVLLRSYDEEADLSPFGRMTARWDTLRFLSNLLMLREAERRVPAIADIPITQPIFITGLPRSGSTFLHSLLSQDPSNRVVHCWETIYPCPERDGRTGAADRRARKVERQLSSFTRIAPEIRSLHPITAGSPQECSEINGHVFRSLRFDTTHAVPSYRRWLDDAGHLAAYRFHKRFLQHLQHQNGPGRWILKCPDHVFALDAIREVYPDACFIVTHRDPLKVLPSVAKLTEALRRPFARRIDRLAIGRQVSERWARGAAILTAGASSASDQLVHLKFRPFVDDPLGCVARLYERFGMTFDREASARVHSFIAARPNGGYGNNHSELKDYGLDAGTERQRYRDYIDCFGI
jgi:hypothetical protein